MGRQEVEEGQFARTGLFLARAWMGPPHLCAGVPVLFVYSCFCVFALVLIAGALVLAQWSTVLVHKMQRANGAHNTIG